MSAFFKLSKFFLFASVFCVIIVSGSTLFPFIVGKYVWFRTAIDLALISFLFGLLFDERGFTRIKTDLRKLKRNPMVIAVTAFTIIFLLSCLFGVDPATSFWSNVERGEGGLQILHFFIFFILLVFLFKDEEIWRKIFIAMLVAGLLMAFYGLGASLKYVDAEIHTQSNAIGELDQTLTGGSGPFYPLFKRFIGSRFSDEGFRFAGSIGNPSYVAAYSIFMFFYALYLLSSPAKDKKKIWRWVLLGLTIVVFGFTFFSSATRGGFVGLIAAILALLAYLMYSQKRLRKWLLLGTLIFLLVIGGLIHFKDTPFVKAIPGSRIFDISFTAQTLQHRMIMWKTAIDGWKERPILGWGPESFLYVFAQHFNTKYYVPSEGFGAYFDRAHSVYFDYLVETGILGLLSFLAIWIVFYWCFSRMTRTKTDEKPKPVSQNPRESAMQKGLLFALPIAYLVQGIVLFDVLPIYVNSFLFLAFIAYKLNLRNKV